MNQSGSATFTIGDNLSPAGNNLASPQTGNAYSPAGNQTPMASAAVANTGGSQAHNNMQPYLVMNFIIALVGLFPSRG